MAVGLALVGGALLLHILRPSRRAPADVAAALAALLGALALAEDGLGVDVGLDQLLHEPATLAHTRWISALGLALLGAAVVCRRRRASAAQLLAGGAWALGLVAFGGHVLGAPSLLGATVSIQTTLALLSLSLAVVLSTAGTGLAARLWTRAPAAAIGMAIAMIVLAGYGSIRNAARVGQDFGWVEHTHQVRFHLNSAGGHLEQLSTQVRGLLVTGDAHYLTKIEEQKDQLRQEVETVAELTSDNPAQQERVGRLRSLVARRTTMAGDAVRMRRLGDTVGPAEQIPAVEALMDEFRALIGEMDAAEQALLVDRRAATSRAQSTSLVGSGLATLLGLVVLGTSLLVVRRANATLDRRVVEATGELAASNRALRMLSDCNQALVRAVDEAALLDAICGVVVKEGGYRLCFVVWAEHDEARSLRVAARAGAGADGVAFPATWADVEGSRGPTCVAIRTGKPAILNDLHDHPDATSLKSAIDRVAAGAAAALPLADDDGTVLGALVVVAAARDAFDDAEMAVLTELAMDLAFGVVTLRARAAHDRAVGALHTERAKLAAALENTPSGIVIADGAMGNIWMNAAALEIHGYASLAEAGARLEDYAKEFELLELDGTPIPFEDWIGARALRGEFLRGYEVVLRQVATDRRRTVTYTSAPARDRDGKTQFIIFTMDDATERKAAERARLQAEAKWRTIFERVTDGLLVADPTTRRFVETNPAMRRMLGYDAAALAELRIEDLVPPEDVAARMEQLAAIQSGALSVIGDVPLVRADGSVIYADVSGSVVEIDGRPFVLGLFHDTTERRRMSLELERHREQLEALVRDRTDLLAEANRNLQLVLDSSSDGIYGVGPDGACSFANRAALEAWGYGSASEVLGRNNHALFHHSHRDGAPYDVAECPIYKVLRGAPLAESGDDEVFWRRDGTPFEVDYRARPLKDGERTLGCVVTFSDATERRAATKQLALARDAAEEASRAKGAFLASMSHEIRTPMNAILGFAQLLRRDTLTDRQRQHLDAILRSAEHLLALITDVLDYSKIEAGRLTIEETTFDLHEVFDDLEASFRMRAEAKGLRFIAAHTEPRPWPIVCDETKLRQILQNLLGNAVKFTERGGVAARARALDGRLVVEVEDTGPGIAANEMSRLFRLFEQAEAGRRSRAGTGLGLAISKRFAELLGGTLEVTSEVGKGSVFRLVLPLRVGTVDRLSRRAPQRVAALAPGQEECRVLVADDVADNRAFLDALLAAVGFAVRTVPDGAEAVRACDEWRPHLVLMDMRMPILDGAGAIAQIRERHGHAIRIIAVTASAFLEDRHEAITAGAHDFLSKPFREEVLFDKIQALLGVRYVVADERPPPPPRARPAPDALRAAASLLPRALVAELHMASLKADLDGIVELAEPVAAYSPELADEVRRLASEFAYPKLIALLTLPEAS